MTPPAAAAVPRRPPSVPDDAVFDDDTGQWRRCGTDADGNLDGPLQAWRDDGTLCFEGAMVAGTLEGPFRRFQPSAQLAREGQYRAGVFDGVVTCHAPHQPGDEPLRQCCVPAGAVRMDARYQRGVMLRETFFDGEGRALQSSGVPRPARVAGIPEHADFEDATQRWFVGHHDADARGAEGTWRWWRLDATLCEEVDFESSRRVAQRLFDDTGALFEENHFALHDGFVDIRQGRTWRRYRPDETVPYDVPGARRVEGNLDRDESVGSWAIQDDSGVTIVQRNLGHGLGDRVVDGGLQGARRPAREWEKMAVDLVAKGRLREAIVARARACAAAGDAAGLRDWLASVVLPLSPEPARIEAARVIEAETHGPREILDALVRGADASPLLRALAVAQGGTADGPLDLADAAILLAPDRSLGYSSRALLRIERGIDGGAAEDAARLRESSPDRALYLFDYLRVLRPDFSFWPEREPPPELPEDVSLAVEQPIEEVRRAVQIYATRFLRIRQALLGFRADAPTWLPPDPTGLLPDGPIELRTFQADIVDEVETPQVEEPGPDGNPAADPDGHHTAGQETSHVTIDESLSLDGLGVPALMRLARASWAALCWICWSVGLDRVALPERIDSHPDFARALAMAMTRGFRAKDALVTGGLRSMTRGVPGFVWEGLDIDLMDKSLAEFAADEYLEIRAALLYLASAGNLSPFQDDLRRL